MHSSIYRCEAEPLLEEVLEYRQKHDADLQQARDKLGWMARRIVSEPWSEEFASELEHKTIPDIADELVEVRKARDACLKSKRGKLALQAAGVAVGNSLIRISRMITSKEGDGSDMKFLVAEKGRFPGEL